jgi:hypothetical protein
MKDVEKSVAPGVLLLGVYLLPFAMFLNPFLLASMFPELLANVLYFRRISLVLHVLTLFLCFRFIWRWRVLGQTWLARVLFERASLLGGTLLCVAGLLSLIAIMEVVLWRITMPPAGQRPRGTVDKFEPGMYAFHPYLGLAPRPGQVYTHRCIKVPVNEPEFIKEYTIGDDGFRVVPQPEVTKTEHLAFFGCSFAFGIGLNDDETLPSRVAMQNPETNVYNFAFGAYSAGQAYLQLLDNVTDKIQEKEGAAIYLLMSDHVFRLLSRINYATKWARRYPAFAFDHDDRARYIGALDTAYPTRLFFLDVISKEKFVKWARLDFPQVAPKEAYKLCAAILAEARSEYRKRFPGNEFYVLMDFTCGFNFEYEYIQAELERRGVPVISAIGLHGESTEHLYYKRDTHPKPEANVILADWLVDRFPNGFTEPPLPR